MHKFVSLIIFLLFSFNLFAQQSCSHLFQAFPKLNNLHFEEKTFHSGKTYRHYKVDASELNDPEYKKFLNETVEVLYEPAEPFGHLRLRVGERQYSFNYIQSTSQNVYSPRSGADRYGFIYMVDPNKIKEMEDEIIKFYKSSMEHNIPPFDAFSPPLKVKRDGASWRYESPSTEYANNGIANGKIIQENGQYYLASPDIKLPVRKIGNDEYETLSYSCVSSTSYWLERFGLQLNRNLEAKGVKKTLLDPRYGASEPDMIFQYNKD
jgi:hypothetical protein